MMSATYRADVFIVSMSKAMSRLTSPGRWIVERANRVVRVKNSVRAIRVQLDVTSRA